MMGNTCGSCFNLDVSSICLECKKYDMYLSWKEAYKKLESQLSRYQRHPFDQEKRETWPELNKPVLIKLLDTTIPGKPQIKYRDSFFDDDGYWMDDRAILRAPSNKNIKVIWWSYLPGEEEEG